MEIVPEKIDAQRARIWGRGGGVSICLLPRATLSLFFVPLSR